MKKVLYLIPLFAFISCGGSGADSTDETVLEDTIYQADHEWIVSANILKEKFGLLQKSFNEIGNKEVEEIICADDTKVPYTGNEQEMNVWLISTYMLDNFSTEEFGQHGFQMPEALIRDVTPLSELNWINFNSLDTGTFSIYQLYPNLIDVPTTEKDEHGKLVSNEESIRKPHTALRAIEDGLFGVIAITDYLPPVYTSGSNYETGYVMGYIMFANWEKGTLSCVSPFLGQNTAKLDFTSTADGLAEMKADLQTQIFQAIDSVARMRTGFEGDVYINDGAKLAKYKE